LPIFVWPTRTEAATDAAGLGAAAAAGAPYAEAPLFVLFVLLPDDPHAARVKATTIGTAAMAARAGVNRLLMVFSFVRRGGAEP
jgi:hypothetical protein